jgi:DNA-binding GntR family transcriptional regulator
LAEAFGVSRGPVREALSGLQQEGLVQLQRHKAARVGEISRDDVAELYELRKELERFAVERAPCALRPSKSWTR